MFGKQISRTTITSLILLGFCVYTIDLFIKSDITLYMHPRYASFSFIAAIIAIGFLSLSLFYETKKQHNIVPKQARIKIVDSIVVVVLILAIALPARALSARAISRKSLNTPTYGEGPSATRSSLTCPTTKPETIDAWVNEIGRFPLNCYHGQAIELTGYVFETPENPLPEDMYYLGRVVMSCCIIDARPYALPIQVSRFERYPKDTWLKVSGKLRTADVRGEIQLVIAPDMVKRIDNPSEPYNYINVPSTQETQSLEPLNPL